MSADQGKIDLMNYLHRYMNSLGINNGNATHEQAIEDFQLPTESEEQQANEEFKAIEEAWDRQEGDDWNRRMDDLPPHYSEK